MFRKNILIILCATLQLANSLKSTDFCILKQQQCKGYYDKQQNYQTKCNPIRCHGTFSFECGFNICSDKLIECNKYNQYYSYMKIFQIQASNEMLSVRHLKDLNNFNLFNKYIPDCKHKISEFQQKLDDFCLNGENCVEIRKALKGFYYYEMSKQIDCKCPAKQSFKCDKYCTTDSIVCDYFKLKEESNSKNVIDIKDCGNHNSTYFKSYASMWF